MSQTYAFNLAMTCESCANAAKRVLGKLGDAVTDVKTDVKTQTVEVTTTLPSDEIITALEKTGKAVSLKA